MRTIGALACDLHRSVERAVAVVEVEVDGRSTRLHLCDHHLAEFRRSLAVWWPKP